jgi:DNA polymerase I-like protein with 3'-5' exonuclease and polymerase domains
MIYLVTKNQELFENSTYKIIGVDESLSLLFSLEIISVDTETGGLDEYTKDLKSVQLGNKDFQIVVDTSTIDIKKYKELFESDKLFLFWYALFDLRFLYRNNIYPRKVYDGYLAEKLMWLGYPSGTHSMSLKAAGENYLGVELDKSVRGKIMYQGLTEEVIVYGANDVKYLEELREKQLEELKKKDLLRAIDIENRFVLVLAYCQHCGVKLDREKWEAKMLKDKKREDNAKKNLDKWLIENEPNSKYIFINRQGDLFEGYNLEPQVSINWNSAKQVAPIFKKYGVEVAIEDKDKGGTKDSIDAKVLKPQKDKCSLIPLYLDYKEATKVTSTYGENFLKQINPISGRIHTNYSQLGADTTRITSGGKDKSTKTEYVNLLNLPADAETRACFVAEDGNKWISIDYSGQETYLMASIANDKAIIEELTNGSGDIHSLTAYMSYHEIPRETPIKDIKKLYHNLRQEAKGIEFAINYGGNADTISRNKGIPIEEANKIYNAYMNGFKGLKAYQDFRRKDWFNKGYILLNPLTGHKAYIYDYEQLKEDKEWMKTLDWDYYREMKKTDPTCYTVERVRRFFKRKSALEKQSINYPIQATGSMCLRLSLIYFFYFLRDTQLLNKVKICVTPYDEINCEAPKEIAEEVAMTLYNCMIKAGAFFCRRCKLDADISRLEDGSLPTYWIH